MSLRSSRISTVAKPSRSSVKAASGRTLWLPSMTSAPAHLNGTLAVRSYAGLKTGNVMCHFDGAIGDIAHLRLHRVTTDSIPLVWAKTRRGGFSDRRDNNRFAKAAILVKPTGETAARMNE